MFESLSNLPLARRWQEQAYPVASVLALIRRDDVSNGDEAIPRYLLIQRQTEPYIGKWGLVGGRWEFGETLETAITREVKEETGLGTTFVALRGLVNERIAPRSPSDEGAHYLLFVCEVHVLTGTAREQSEGPVAWYGLEELKELSERQAIIFTDHAIIRRFTQNGAGIPYIEAEVVASSSEKGTDELVRFSLGP